MTGKTEPRLYTKEEISEIISGIIDGLDGYYYTEWG